MSKRLHSDRCANPFKKPDEQGHTGKSLRLIPKSMLEEYPHLSETSKICSKCVKKFNDKSFLDESNDSTIPMETLDDFASTSNDSTDLNPEKKENREKSQREMELEEMLDGLKEKFSNLSKTDPLRLQILTIAPSTWSTRKLANEFSATRYLAAKAKKIKSQQGILPNTTIKAGKTLPQNTVDKIFDFYTSDTNGRLTSNTKDFVSVNIEGKRVHQQKRLLFLNLSDLYSLFKQAHPDCEVGFSTFAKLRPKYCILPGASGTHSVCVCTIHQNVKLMLDAIDLKNLTKDTNLPLSDYQDCLKNMTCENSSPKCYIDECDKCPGTKNILEHIHRLLENKGISHVQYSIWSGTDRSTLLNNIVKCDKFLIELDNKLTILKPHSFISKQQSLFVKEKKINLKEGEVLVMYDFAENYCYVCQDASQAFHFNNDQCTVFPVIYYYKEDGELKHKSNVFLSNSKKHDTAAVYSIQQQLIPEIKKNVKKVGKIIYVSDGAKQHFKNKFQIANLIYHKEDFNVIAEWHFFTTAHGKSAYDGIGANFKREAYRASLTAKPKDALLTSEALFNWGKKNFKNINIFYFDEKYHAKMQRKLNRRFEAAEAVPEISKQHGFIVDNQRNVCIKRYSKEEGGIQWSMYADNYMK